MIFGAGSTLGVIPSEAELSTVFQRWPVHTGWIDGELVTPLGDAQTLTITDEYMTLQRRNSWLQAISTIAVVAVAGVAIAGCFKRRR